jgi:hypothetical protein
MSGIRKTKLHDELREAEQYLVDDANGRDLGIVDEVVIRDGVIAGLYARRGWRTRRDWIPVEAVVDVDRWRRVVVVNVQAQQRE